MQPSVGSELARSAACLEAVLHELRAAEVHELERGLLQRRLLLDEEEVLRLHVAVDLAEIARFYVFVLRENASSCAQRSTASMRTR